MTITERIHRARRLEAQYRAEAVGLSMSQSLDLHSSPLYSANESEQDAFLRGLHEGREIRKVGQ